MPDPVDTESLKPGPDGRLRCWWCHAHDDYREYHDREWGLPVAEDHRLFEKICLEGFQSGLSWLTILRKRENFRRAFRDFDFVRIARFTQRDVNRLLSDQGIIRHRGKIEATINNASRAVALVAEFGSLAAWVWQFEPSEEDVGLLESKSQACERTTCPEAVDLSKQLRKRGWKFVGPTTAYAFMQAMGMVNDHLKDCEFRRKVSNARNKFRRPIL
ncbi:MAG: DNA-3-methyladenine glycosylase I [Planctomycetaceae bacterium]